MKVPIALTPGINKEISPTANRSGFSDGDKVRFFQGLPETIQGWQDTSAGSKFNGVCRGVHIWQTLLGQVYVAVGTTTQLYLWSGGKFFDITPLRHDTIISNPFQTTIGSSVVIVNATSHGTSTGDLVAIKAADSVGGLAMNGTVTATFIDQDTWSFVAAGPAIASATGGGPSVELAYYIPTGNSVAAPQTGYGVGAYGVGTYGTPRTPLVSTFSADPRSWSLDNWGEDLVANPSDGGIYLWRAVNGTDTRAQSITEAPPNVAGILVSAPDRHLIAIGAGFEGQQDPLMVNFSSSEDYTDWTASELNTAGSQRVPGGSRLLQIVRTRGEMLLLSDTEAYAMRFVGFPYVFGFFPVGTLCGAISRHCAADFNGITYWMGRENFFRYDGRAQVIPCPLRDFVFDNIDLSQGAKVYCGIVRKPASEVWWLYQDKASTTKECNRYIAYSTTENTFHIGSLDRTAIIDGQQLNLPLMASSDGSLFYHETGTTAAGQPMTAFIETGDFMYGEGDQFFFTDRIVPDFQWPRISPPTSPPGVDVYIKWRRYPNTPQQQKGPYTFLSTTEFRSTRVRSRQQSLRFQSTGPFRLGRLSMNIKPDGKR